MNDNLWQSLELNSWGIKIEYIYTKNHILNLFENNNVLYDMPTDTELVVKSKLLSINVKATISFVFKSNSLISIIISLDKIKKDDLLYRYKKIQKLLKSELGFPNSYASVFLNIFDKDNQLNYWKKRDLKIEHFLLDRFEMEEIITISKIE